MTRVRGEGVGFGGEPHQGGSQPPVANKLVNKIGGELLEARGAGLSPS